MNTPRTLSVAMMLSVSSAGCSDSDAEIIPTGQFDDGTYEIFGPPINGVQESLGLIYAHKGTTTADYSRSYEIWAVSGNYCSSDKLDPTTMKPCSYQALTFKYKAERTFSEWVNDVNAKNYNNARYYRATYKARADKQGLVGCGMSTMGMCTFDPGTNSSTRVSMFPVKKVYNQTSSTLPMVVVQQKSGITTETWYMNAFFNSSLGDAGFTFSGASDATGSVDCAACSAPVQVDVKYKPCTAQPINELDSGCTETPQ